MSKDKPEVGDVFYDKKYQVKLYVVGKSFTPETYDALETDGINVDKVICCVFDEEQYTYLGKSKANINDLFEVQDDK